MTNLNRRSFLKATSGAIATSGLSFPFIASAKNKRVVVVGGGVGGLIAAKYITKGDSSIEVTVVEPKAHHHTCFMSNEVIGGDRDISTIKFGYDNLASHGIKLVQDKATMIDAEAHKVMTAGGTTLEYDRCVVSPGISLKFGAIDGYSEEAAEIMPHSWIAGKQTALLRGQIGIYGRWWLGRHCATSKPIPLSTRTLRTCCTNCTSLKTTTNLNQNYLIIDAKDKFSKQGLFMQGYKDVYGDMIEWVAWCRHGWWHQICRHQGNDG